MIYQSDYVPQLLWQSEDGKIQHFAVDFPIHWDFNGSNIYDLLHDFLVKKDAENLTALNVQIRTSRLFFEDRIDPNAPSPTEVRVKSILNYIFDREDDVSWRLHDVAIHAMRADVYFVPYGLVHLVKDE